MLLVMLHIEIGQLYIAQQKQDFKFNRLDTKASSGYMYGRKWIKMSRWMTGLNEWTQVGPLNMVQWSK